jgi:hypothetical protein
MRYVPFWLVTFLFGDRFAGKIGAKFVVAVPAKPGAQALATVAATKILA